MVEVGSIQIGGSIQTAEIERGLGRVEKGFSNIDTKSKSVNADFTRINQQALRLGRNLGIMALAGVGAMVAIAKGSPAVAGAMAKIKVTAGKLSRALGEALAPAFDLAADAFSRFTGWIEEHKEGISHFTTTILGGLIDAIDGIKTGWDWITTNIKDISAKIGIDIDLGSFGNYLLEHFGPEAVAALIMGGIGAGIGGVIGGPVGAGVGFGVGAGVGAVGVGVGRRINDIKLLLEEALYSGIQSFAISMGRKGMTFGLVDAT